MSGHEWLNRRRWIDKLSQVHTGLCTQVHPISEIALRPRLRKPEERLHPEPPWRIISYDRLGESARNLIKIEAPIQDLGNT